MEKKIAVVTGAGAGIGQSIAVELARRGYCVYAAARSKQRLQKTLALCEGCDVQPLVFDTSNEAEVKQVLDGLARIDCLVNNAGVSIPKKTQFDEADWDLILGTNVKGYFFVIKHALKKMGRGSSIVNLSSGAAKTGGDFVSLPYAASKGAINTMTVCYARDLAGEGIRVNAVSPGFVDTAMLALNGKEKSYYDTVIPMGRLGTPRDIANAVAFLLSEEASFITGQILEVNGGDIMG